MRRRVTKLFAGLVLTALSACALHVRNVAPPAAFHFAYLTQMALYAQGAYGDEAAIRSLCRPAFDQVYVKVIPTTNNQYFLATSSATHVQLLSIAGTANIENVLLDADQTPAFFHDLHISLHRGFARAARLIYDDVRPHLVAGYRLDITGHSLGGAEAVILGMILTSGGTSVGQIVTFGQPRVTDAAGVSAYRNLPLTRVVNQNDVIPALPLAPYRPLGPELVLFPGKTYSLVEERPIRLAELRAAWQALARHEAPPELPEHYIASYLVNLQSKTTNSQLIPYPQ